jgi:hypothetical protein
VPRLSDATQLFDGDYSRTEHLDEKEFLAPRGDSRTDEIQV